MHAIHTSAIFDASLLIRTSRTPPAKSIKDLYHDPSRTRCGIEWLKCDGSAEPIAKCLQSRQLEMIEDSMEVNFRCVNIRDFWREGRKEVY
jgi:hypothetical protein